MTEPSGVLNLDHLAQGRPDVIADLQAIEPGSYIHVQEVPDNMQYLIDIHAKEVED